MLGLPDFFLGAEGVLGIAALELVDLADVQAIENALTAPLTVLDGEPLYRETWERASVLAMEIIRQKPFGAEGFNLAVAQQMMVMLIVAEGRVWAEPRNTPRFLRGVARHEIPRAAFMEWVRDNIR